MKSIPIHPAELVSGSQIGVPIRFTKTAQGITVDIGDAEQFERAESKLRLALEGVGLGLDPLGYIQDACAQYRVYMLDSRSISAGRLNGAAIQSTLSALIDRARHSDGGMMPPADAGKAVEEDGARTSTGPSISALQIGVHNSDLGDPERDKDEPDPADIVTASPDASAPCGKAYTERLRRCIEQGPDLIMVNRHPMPWASAIAPPDAVKDEAVGRVTLRVMDTEHYLRDGNRNRIRPRESDEPVAVGATIEMTGVTRESVLMVTLPNQQDLDMGHDEDED